jgi:hypothetical protein
MRRFNLCLKFLTLGLLVAPLTAHGQTFGGLGMNNSCSDWQRASPDNRQALISDLLSGYSMNARINLSSSQRSDAQACMRTLFAEPCALPSMTIQQGLGMCLTQLGIGR